MSVAESRLHIAVQDVQAAQRRLEDAIAKSRDGAESYADVLKRYRPEREDLLGWRGETSPDAIPHTMRRAAQFAERATQVLNAARNADEEHDAARLHSLACSLLLRAVAACDWRGDFPTRDAEARSSTADVGREDGAR